MGKRVAAGDDEQEGLIVLGNRLALRAAPATTLFTETLVVVPTQVLGLPSTPASKRFLPAESALKNQTVRRPDGEFGLQRIVPGFAQRIARNRDPAELRERTQRLRHRIGVEKPVYGTLMLYCAELREVTLPNGVESSVGIADRSGSCRAPTE